MQVFMWNLTKTTICLVPHEVVDQIERKCLEEYGTNLVIHLDPVITDDVEINR